MLYPIQTLWGSKRFDSGISISFKRKCNIIMQTQYTKNITDPERFELDTKLSKPTRSIMLEWNWYQRFVKLTRKNHQYVVKSRFPRNFKTGHFKSLIEEKGAAKCTQLKNALESMQNCSLSWKLHHAYYLCTRISRNTGISGRFRHCTSL